jgi:hypothetical protein
MGRLNVLQAYTDPIQMWTATAPIGINQRLKDVPAAREISSSRTVIVAAEYIPHGDLPS